MTFGDWDGLQVGMWKRGEGRGRMVPGDSSRFHLPRFWWVEGRLADGAEDGGPLGEAKALERGVAGGARLRSASVDGVEELGGTLCA